MSSMTKLTSAPSTYEDWKVQALEKDRKTGAERWKEQDSTRDFDFRIIRRRYDELVEIRTAGDVDRLIYFFNEGIHGNMGGMGAPALYKRAAFGTKNLIRDFTNELVAALNQIEALPSSTLKKQDKLDLFRRAGLCFGHSALMLSGAGSLGPFHIGVVRTMFQEGILPRVISGASAGSMVAAVVCTRTDEELAELFASDQLNNLFGEMEGAETGKRISQENVRALIEALIPDMTFIEAFEKTGRYINVSVAAKEVMQRSRMLNSTTSPTALIREAVLASCAIPGIFPPVTLAARNGNGEKCAYVPSRQWVDGSVTHDLPAHRLARQYGVNHFISSQTNPMVLWALQEPDSDSLFQQFSSIYQSASREWLRAIYPSALQVVKNIYPLNLMTRTWFNLITQEYTADINILPQQKFYNPGMLLEQLSEEDTQKLVNEGEKATWPKVEQIRICTAVSRCLDDILMRLDGTIR